MIAVEAEAAALDLVAMRSASVRDLGEGVITVIMIEAEGLVAEAQVEEVAEVEVLGEGETGAQSEKAVLREGLKLNSGTGKGRILNLLEIRIANPRMTAVALTIIMGVRLLLMITISIHQIKEMEIMTSRFYAVIMVGQF